jgi:hypothetical protein
MSWWKHHFNPMTYIRAIKYFCQRGWRGYADCDSWDADGYFEIVMIGVLTHLRETTPGYPASLAEYGPGEDVPEGVVDSGMDRWKAVLTEIIDGLNAAQELRKEDTVPDGVYSDEPIEWEKVKEFPEEKESLWRMKDSETPRFNQVLFDQWAEPLKRKERRAKYLLAKYWGSFWD